MTLKIALLGVEHYHATFWTKAVECDERATLAGVWDADGDAALRFCATHGGTAFAERDALLAAADAVMICSATAAHQALIRAAAGAGLPILCEKPLGLSLDDALDIERFLERAAVPFMQSFPKRFDPATRAVREIVASGDLGTLTLVRVRHGHGHGLDAKFRDAWFCDPVRSGGGTLLDEGIHAADFLRHVIGEPIEAFATVSSATLSLDVEDTALAVFRYASGLLAEVATGWCLAAADDSIELYGTEGTLLLGGVDLASRPTRESGFLRVFRGGAWEVSDLVPHFRTGVFHEHVAWAFIEALHDGKPFAVTAHDGVRALALIDAAYRSAREGRRVSIDSDAESLTTRD